MNQADDAALVCAAKNVWYSHSDLLSEARIFLSQHSDELEVRRAGYLLERFTRFSCVTDHRVAQVYEALELFWCVAPKQQVVSNAAVALRNAAMNWHFLGDWMKGWV